jgi:hypothetical protein
MRRSEVGVHRGSRVDLQCSLDCVHHLHIFPPVTLRGRIHLPFPRPSRARLSIACIVPSSCSTVEVAWWRCYLFDFLLRRSAFSVTSYNISPCVTSCIKQCMLFVLIRCEMCVLTSYLILECGT